MIAALDQPIAYAGGAHSPKVIFCGRSMLANEARQLRLGNVIQFGADHSL